MKQHKYFINILSWSDNGDFVSEQMVYFFDFDAAMNTCESYPKEFINRRVAIFGPYPLSSDALKKAKKPIKAKKEAVKTDTKKYGNRLSPKVKAKITELIKKGWSAPKICARYNVSAATVYTMKYEMKKNEQQIAV